jgi:hypothetical protein
MGSVACAWCGIELRRDLPGTFISHGMCVPCSGRNGFVPVEELPATVITSHHIPCGTFEIDEAGHVLSYREHPGDQDGGAADGFLHRPFFDDVAPWGTVRQLKSRFQEVVAKGAKAEIELAFLARTLASERLVFFTLNYDPAAHAARVVVEHLA